MAQRTKQEILDILASHRTVVFFANDNPNKQPEIERLIEPFGLPVLSVSDVATLLGTSTHSLKSPQDEEDYISIAKGKVSIVKDAIMNSDLPETIRKKMLLLGDDYGAAVAALHFTYDAKAPEFQVDFDEHNHISTIRTNRAELDKQPAPGYFSRRIIRAVALHHGINPDDKKAAFDAFASEIFYAAQRSDNRSTTATVAIAWGRPVAGDEIHGIKEQAAFQLTDPDSMPKEGYAFDRIQSLRGRGIVANWSSAEKDKNFPRGQAVREAMKQALAQEGFAVRAQTSNITQLS